MGTLAGTLVYSWEHLTTKPVEWDAALTTWLSCWLDLDPSTVNTLNPCFPHHLPPKGFLVKISGPHSTLQHPSSLASHWHRRGLGCVFPDGAQGGSGWQRQVSAGSFPSLSLSCP